MKNISIICLLVLMLAGCKDVFKPEIENNRQLEEKYSASDAKFPYGLILNGYNRIPTNSWSFNDVATDDAVSSDEANSYLKVATGQWTSSFNPFDQWTNSFAAIQYMNLTLEQIGKITWAQDTVVSTLFAKRVRGEALGLRAMFYYYLLQSHGGAAANGELLGVPLITQSQTVNENFNLPRATFKECVQQINSDLDQAETLLPIDYADLTSDAQVPPKYGSVTKEQYNRAMGKAMSGLFSGRIAMAFRAKTALLAASPAFEASGAASWANAADAASEILDLKGGVAGLAPLGLTWYGGTDATKAEIAALAEGANPPEILWRNNYGESNDLEVANFPPTLNGRGNLNPTQNLVDAFPMVNGYPISKTAGSYNSAAPYTNRDPRLEAFIVINNSKAGVNSSTIITAADGTTNDALNKVETSTRTGYYLRKLLRQDVNLSSTSTTTQRHYKPHIRYTEIYLLYAEAANEAWGPLGTGTHTYSAYDVIKAIRRRAGIGLTNGDAYLESIKSDKEAMRQLIRNERRLELCFEGFRFWDLRRWKSTLTEAASGMSITNNATYSIIPVESRVYQNYMNYGPLPYSEVLKFNAIIQNKGW